MNVLQPEEESLLLGKPYGAFIIYSPANVGAVYSFTIGSTTVSYTVQASDTVAVDPLMSVANGLLTQIRQNLNGYLAQSATISALNNGLGLVTSTAIQFSLLPANGSTTFSITPVSNVVVVANGTSLPSPMYVVDDGNGNAAAAQVAYGLLPVCDALEAQLLSASQNLGFSQVGSESLGQAVFRPDELKVRNNLLARYRYEMGVMLAFYPPNAQSGIKTTQYSV